MYGLITYDAQADVGLFERTVVSGRLGRVTEYDESKRFVVIIAGHSPDVYFENRAGAESFCFGHFRSSLNPTEPAFIVLLDPIHPAAYEAKRDGVYGLTNVDSSVKKLFEPSLPTRQREKLDRQSAIDTQSHRQQESQKNLLSLVAVVGFFILMIYLAVK